jgi:hypothetical protein
MITIFFALILFMAPIHSVAGAERGETPRADGHWSEDVLNAWAERGWLAGDGEGNLRPDDAVTRAEFASMINRSFGLGQLPAGAEFPDLPGSDWAYGAIVTAVAEGYLRGYGDGTVKPHRPLTREEAAVIVARLLGLDTSYVGGAELAFTDRGDIAPWSAAAVAAVSRAGIFKGFPDGSFRPRAHLTRAEAAAGLSRALAAGLGTVYAKPGTYGPEDAATYQGEVDAGRGIRIESLSAGMQVNISLAGLDAGTYKFVDARHPQAFLAVIHIMDM